MKIVFALILGAVLCGCADERDVYYHPRVVHRHYVQYVPGAPYYNVYYESEHPYYRRFYYEGDPGYRVESRHYEYTPGGRLDVVTY